MYTYHDELLSRMSGYGCTLKNGFSNHVPMVVEALAAMDEETHASDWFERSKNTISPRPKRVAPITRWVDALGERHRFSDWASFFEQSMEDAGWEATLNSWLPRLTKGFMSAANHGVIRVGHATRALQNEDTPPRRAELAAALAAWCSSYAELPDRPTSTAPTDGEFNGSEILSDLALLDGSLRRNDGAITTAVGQLAQHPDFYQQVSRLQLGNAHETLPEAAALAAEVFLQNATTPLGFIVFTHGITGLAATHHLLAYLTGEEQRQLVFEAFVAVATLHVVYASAPFNRVAITTETSLDDLKRQAVRNGDDHVIKLTEACLFFYGLSQEPVFLAPPERAIVLLS